MGREKWMYCVGHMNRSFFLLITNSRIIISAIRQKITQLRRRTEYRGSIINLFFSADHKTFAPRTNYMPGSLFHEKIHNSGGITDTAPAINPQNRVWKLFLIFIETRPRAEISFIHSHSPSIAQRFKIRTRPPARAYLSPLSESISPLFISISNSCKTPPNYPAAFEVVPLASNPQTPPPRI